MVLEKARTQENEYTEHDQRMREILSRKYSKYLKKEIERWQSLENPGLNKSKSIVSNVSRRKNFQLSTLARRSLSVKNVDEEIRDIL